MKESILCVADYYGTDGARELAHRVKQNDIFACEAVTEAILKQGLIPPGATLIPIPSRAGFATNNLTICIMLSKKMDIMVSDCVGGAPRSSLYDLKKNGEAASESFFGFFLKEEEPGGDCFLFDAVVDTGMTLSAARKLFQKNEPSFVSYAMVDKHLFQPNTDVKQTIPVAYLENEHPSPDDFVPRVRFRK